MKRHVIEGLWRGYSSSMDRVVHREVSTSPKLIEWVRKTFCIHYTDGTTLELSVRECKPRERVEERLGYRSLIRDCFYNDVNSVDALYRLKEERRAGMAVQDPPIHPRLSLGLPCNRRRSLSCGDCAQRDLWGSDYDRYGGGQLMDRYEVIEHMRQAHDRVPDVYFCSREGMAAALDVVLGEVLGDDGDYEVRREWDALHNKELSAYKDAHKFPGDAGFRACMKFLASRRAHYSKVKTAEEQMADRVTIKEGSQQRACPFDVWLDGFWQLGFGTKQQAEIYRLGLIAQLKAGNQ